MASAGGPRRRQRPRLRCRGQRPLLQAEGCAAAGRELVPEPRHGLSAEKRPKRRHRLLRQQRRSPLSTEAAAGSGEEHLTRALDSTLNAERWAANARSRALEVQLALQRRRPVQDSGTLVKGLTLVLHVTCERTQNGTPVRTTAARWHGEQVQKSGAGTTQQLRERVHACVWRCGLLQCVACGGSCRIGRPRRKPCRAAGPV